MAGAGPHDLDNIEKVELDGVEDIRKAIRLSIMAELDAANLYEMIAEGCGDEKVKKLMMDIANEEKVHAGEFMKLLKTVDEEEGKHWEEGEEEAAGVIYGNEMTGTDAEAEPYEEPEVGKPFPSMMTQPLDDISTEALEGLNEEIDEVLAERKRQ